MLLVVSCAQRPSSGTPVPTSTEVVAQTPTVTVQEDSGFNFPDPSSIPEGVAPLGLGDIGLPDDPEGMAVLFNELPDSFRGVQRTFQSDNLASDEVRASYGTTQPVGCGTVGLQAIDISNGDFYPQGWTSERVLAVFTTGADWNVEDFGRDKNLFWVIWDTTCGTHGTSGEDSIFTISWGQAGSPWFFSASAGDTEDRDELTAAFVSASR